MKKVFEYGSSLVVTRASALGNGPALVMSATDEKMQQELSQEYKNLENQEEYLTYLQTKLDRYTASATKNIEDGKAFAEALHGYGDTLRVNNYPDVASGFEQIADFLKKFENLKSELNSYMIKLSNHMGDVLRVTIADAWNAKAKCERVKEKYETAMQKIKSHEKGKVKLEKLKELEDEKDDIKKQFKQSTEETHTIVTNSNYKCTWELLLKLCEYSLDAHAAHYGLGRMLIDKQVNPKVDEYKQKVKEIQETVATTQASKWGFVAPRKISQLGQRSFLKERRSRNDADVSVSDAILEELKGPVSFDVIKGHLHAWKKRLLTIDGSREGEEISQARSHLERTKSFGIDKLLQIIKSRSNNRKLKLQWSFVDTRSEYVFTTPEMREKFYEYATFLQRGGLKKPLKLNQTVEIFVGTWNMGEAQPPADLEPWIPKDKYDLYVINTQECEYTPRKGNANCEQDWFDYVTSHLGTNYIKVTGISLLSIRMVIFVKREYYYRITHLQTLSVATGIGGVIGNKGAVAAAFHFNETSFCFIGSHLAARQGEWENRNANFRDIVKTLKFDILGVQDFDVLNMCDHLVWCGDLNYRIDIERSKTLEMIRKKDYASLLEKDQLKLQQKYGNVFVGFQEEEITFPPTYRYNRGDRTYSVEKERIPAWCDRILHKSLPGSSLIQTSYNCCDALMTSDHSPVFGTFVATTWLPAPPVSSLPNKIVITDLRGENLRPMDSHQSADPYVAFFAPFLDGIRTTDVVEKTLSPVWRDTQVPKLLPFVWNRDNIKNQHIFVVVRHHSNDDDMGQGAISLMEAVVQAKPVEFTCQLSYKGKHQGVLKGTISVGNS